VKNDLWKPGPLVLGLATLLAACRPPATPTPALPKPATARNDALPLSPVNDFVYQLQDIDLTAIGDTAYDLVVIDYSADGSDETAFTAAQIAALKHSPGGDKIVLAYMSIGEAEDYRFYWRDGWRPGEPAWLDAENPDWPGNYKVRYWHSDWQAIIYGRPDSYLDKVIAAGFDGIYLDIVDAYEYYQAEQGRASAAQEMADFVAGLADYARARRPGFLVVPQNAAGLAALIPAYLDSVDGIGQEDVYYGYDDDDRPTPPHVTAEIERDLDLFRAAGKLVLTVDYAAAPAHVDDAYAKSQAKGYVPYVTVRDLDRLVVNPGHEPD
jgi:cysteinyl-tRNA synthetase